MEGSLISKSKAGIWTNGLLQKMNLSLLPLVATIEQNTYYAPSKGGPSASPLAVVVCFTPKFRFGTLVYCCM